MFIVIVIKVYKERCYVYIRCHLAFLTTEFLSKTSQIDILHSTFTYIMAGHFSSYVQKRLKVENFRIDACAEIST